MVVVVVELVKQEEVVVFSVMPGQLTGQCWQSHMVTRMSSCTPELRRTGTRQVSCLNMI